MRDEKFRLFFTGNQQFKDICESFSELLQFQSLVCNFGTSIKEARDRAYALCGQVHFAGKKCRSDIAYQALK